jgi:hypothetical protein
MEKYGANLASKPKHALTEEDLLCRDCVTWQFSIESPIFGPKNEKWSLYAIKKAQNKKTLKLSKFSPKEG